MKRIKVHKILTLFILQVITSGTLLYSQGNEKDQVVDTVKCRNATGQTYALYTPAQYDNEKSWPVIIIFDPGARGRTGVTSFLEAGRKYGFILACSNNSRNGPLENNFIAATAMLKDIEERFKIDQRRIYTAGFSGGSRFAITLAVTDRRIAGVIGCGAGLPNDRNYIPAGNSSFLYYGLAGTRDMNYPEMTDLYNFFNTRTSVVSYFRTFEGGHHWPGPDLTTQAVEWLLHPEMIRKIIPSDQTFLSSAENKTQNLINSQLSTGNQKDAATYMRYAIRDFRGTPFATLMIQLLSDTEKSTGYKSAIRRWNKAVETEEENKEKYLDYLSKTVVLGSVPDSATIWWKNEMEVLKRLRDKGSRESSHMASRVLNFLSILCSDQGSSFYRNKKYEQAAYLFGICTMSDSENPNNYYNLARSLALSGKTKRAVDALNVAVSFGTITRIRVDSEAAFVSIRDNSRYKEMLYIKMFFSID